MFRCTILLWLASYLVGCASLIGVRAEPGGNGKPQTRLGETKTPASVLRVKVTLKQAQGQFGPSTEVILSVLRDKPVHHLLANVNAVCSERLQDANALHEVRCWHAGAGQNFTFRKHENELLVSRTDVSEEVSEVKPQVIHRIRLSRNQTVMFVK